MQTRRAPSVSLLVPALFALGAGCAGELPAPPPPPAHEAPATPAAPEKAPPTVDEARQFLKGVDADLRRLWVAGSRAAWVKSTFITDDTEALSAAAEDATMEYLTRTIKAATRFD